MNLIYAVLLAAIGLAALLIELFVPAAGLIGLVGAGCMIAAVSIGFTQYGPTAGILFIAALVVLNPLIIILWFRRFPRSRIGRKLILFPPSSPEECVIFHKGMTGKALTDLRPSGMAVIEQKKISVLSGGGYISGGTHIEILKIDGNRIEVRKLAESDEIEGEE